MLDVLNHEQLHLGNWSQLRKELIWCYAGVPAVQSGRFYGSPVAAWLLLRGSVELRVGRNPITAKAGEWLFTPIGAGSHTFSADAEILSLRFAIAWPTGQPLFDHGEGIVWPDARSPHLQLAARKLIRLVGKIMPGVLTAAQHTAVSYNQHAHIMIALERWLLAYVQTMRAAGLTPTLAGTIDSRAVAIGKFIDDLSFGTVFRDDEVARRMDLSVRQMTRIYISAFGRTPRQYFEIRRLERAMGFLSQTNESMKVIAFHLGFSSLQHFSNWFRRQKGVSPRAYRTKELELKHLRPPAAAAAAGEVTEKRSTVGDSEPSQIN